MRVTAKLGVVTLLLVLLWKCSIDEYQSKPKSERQQKVLTLHEESIPKIQETPRNFKVALLGDSGREEGFERVLQLVKRQEADMVIHLGDFSYHLLHKHGAKLWNEKLNRVLGEKFPYFFVVGNHEAIGWNAYVELFHERLKHLPPGTCTVDKGKKDLGVKSYCQYKGLFFLLSGVGTKGFGHTDFIKSALEKHQSSSWKICAWHKNQNSLQLGSKIDEVGWKPYELCQKYGALVGTGHEHSYGRTRTLTDVGNVRGGHGAVGVPEKVELSPGKNFVFVCGTGGRSFRPYNCAKGDLDPWWASAYTTNYVVKNREVLKNKACLDDMSEFKWDGQTDVDYGALFIEFNYEGDNTKAKARFVTTEDRVLDEFMINRGEEAS